MRIIKLMLMYIFLATCLATPLVLAESEPASSGEDIYQKKHGDMRNKHQKIYDQLNLSEEQKKQLEANKDRSRQVKKETYGKKRSLRETLHQELMKPDLDMAKINEIQAQIKSLDAQMAEERLNSILKVRKILTPDQFKKFLSLLGHPKDKESFRKKK